MAQRPRQVMLIGLLVAMLAGLAFSVPDQPRGMHPTVPIIDSLRVLQVDHAALAPILDDFLIAERECSSHSESHVYAVIEHAYEDHSRLALEGLGPSARELAGPVVGAFLHDGHLFIVGALPRLHSVFSADEDYISVHYTPWCPEEVDDDSAIPLICAEIHHSIWTIEVDRGEMRVASRWQACF